MNDAEFVQLMNSTIVRSQTLPRVLPLTRVANRALSLVAPGLAARFAERGFLTPRRDRPPGGAGGLLASARARPVPAGDGTTVQTWRWGAGPTVLLVHGWGGRGSQLGAFVEPLAARGFSVVAFDAPAHGASTGRQATIPQIVAGLQAVAAAHGPVTGLVAHSVGAVVAARALHEGLEADAAVFVGPAADLVGPAVRFTEMMGFSSRVGDAMRTRVERRVGLPWSAFRVTALAPALRTPLLVVHDRGDAEIPWQHGKAIAQAWRGAGLLSTDGLGHRRILRDPDVVAAAVAFLGARAEEARLAPVDALSGTGAVMAR
jgi:pimeloyl-ACP methyl ester carboxylesterase